MPIPVSHWGTGVIVCNTHADPCAVPVMLLAQDLSLRDVFTIARYELMRWYPPAPKLAKGDTPVTIESSLLGRNDLEALVIARERFAAAVQNAFSAIRKAASRTCWQNIPEFDPEVDVEYPPLKEPITPCVGTMMRWVDGFIVDSFLEPKKSYSPPYDAITEVKKMLKLVESEGGAEWASLSSEYTCYQEATSVVCSSLQRCMRSLQASLVA